MTQETAGVDVVGMLNDWKFWLAALGYLMVHIAHNAVLQWRMKVSENRPASLYS